MTEPYDLNRTPFAALLSNGQPHTVTLTPYAVNDYWLVDATLFLDEDPAGTPTRALTADTLRIAPDVRTVETDNPDGSTTVDVSVARDWTLSGYIETPPGAQDDHGHHDVAVPQRGPGLRGRRAPGHPAARHRGGDGHGRPAPAVP